jgi:hypothetical protein
MHGCLEPNNQFSYDWPPRGSAIAALRAISNQRLMAISIQGGPSDACSFDGLGRPRTL